MDSFNAVRRKTTFESFSDKWRTNQHGQLSIFIIVYKFLVNLRLEAFGDPALSLLKEGEMSGASVRRKCTCTCCCQVLKLSRKRDHCRHRSRLHKFHVTIFASHSPPAEGEHHQIVKYKVTVVVHVCGLYVGWGHLQSKYRHVPKM